MQSVTPFLMFDGNAEEALKLYISILDNAKIEDLQHYTNSEEGPVGKVKLATFEIGGCRCRCIDTPIKHQFSFTPSLSLYAEFATEEKLDKAYGELVKNGRELMPLDKYPFAKKYAWLDDRFGVSWQLAWLGQ